MIRRVQYAQPWSHPSTKIQNWELNDAQSDTMDGELKIPTRQAAELEQPAPWSGDDICENQGRSQGAGGPPPPPPRNPGVAKSTQGYTHDACRSPAAVFTECAQFRARLSARPRKRVVGPPCTPPRAQVCGLSRELLVY